jgi:hypothetical protein
MEMSDLTSLDFGDAPQGITVVVVGIRWGFSSSGPGDRPGTEIFQRRNSTGLGRASLAHFFINQAELIPITVTS